MAAGRHGLAHLQWASQASVSGAVSLAGFFAAVHLAMLGYDLQHPDRFLSTDRTSSRMPAIEGFFATWRDDGDLVGYLAANGLPGDWLPHAILYYAGGQYFVIALQVVLAIASVLWVREIGMRLGLGERGASAAALLYGLLPHTLVLPHQLATEALSVPLVVLSFVLALRGLGAARHAAAGAALGLATLVRPVTMLWPMAQAVLAPASLRSRLAYLAAGLAPLLLWMTFMLAATGVFTTGDNYRDLSHNLYERVERMSARLPAVERMTPRPPGQRKLTLREYAAFCLEHPGAALAHSGRDLLVFAFKSGLEGRVFLDYLAFFPEQRNALQDSSTGWRAQVERHGFAGALLAIFHAAPGLVTIAAGGAVLFGTLVGFAFLGALAWARAGAEPATRRARFLLIAFVAYVTLTAQAASEAESRHRAPAEFALCLLAVAGWNMVRRKGDRHGA